MPSMEFRPWTNLYQPSVDYIATKWAHLVETHPPAVIEFIGTLLVHFGTFWFVSLIFLSLDLLSWPSLQRHKIQALSRQPDHAAIKRCLVSALYNELITTSLHLLQLLLLHFLGRPQVTYRIPAELPRLSEFLTEIAFCTMGREILFYYGHRLLHHPSIYSRFHKQHHKFRTPIALASQYAHPVEHVVSNIIPVAWPARAFNVHILTLWCFMAGVITQASLAHSGYHLLGVFGWRAKVHDLHHELLNVNYGVIGFLDYVHGTRYFRRKKD